IERYDDAISCYERARGNKTLRNDARYKIARTYALAENWDAAYAAFTALRTHDEDNAALKASCAYVTAMSGRTDEALRQYKALVEQYPYDESLLANYITLLLSDGRAERAEPEVARFKETFPDSTAYDTLERTLSALLDAEAAH
ncbi:MAG: tetratricopeptide repeat protein, partial [Treponema sp.]|nr:tetratricopeptide repeat protein [Treponema sp.]